MEEKQAKISRDNFEEEKLRKIDLYYQISYFI